jgi:hypothetical protein
MKNFYYARLREEARQEKFDEYPGFAESGMEPEEILKEVDRILKPLGLEIHLAHPGDTSTLFKIVKKN